MEFWEADAFGGRRASFVSKYEISLDLICLKANLSKVGSNGASQAILDAVAPSSALQNEKSIPEVLTAYQDARLPPTAKICFANRANGPDHVLQLAHERAPDGFENINDVIGTIELEEVGKACGLLAGFDMESVNKKAKETEGLLISNKKQMAEREMEIRKGSKIHGQYF